VRCGWAWPAPLGSARGADARRAARPVVGATGKPCNAADAPLAANPSYPCRFPLMRRCRLLIGYRPNSVGSAKPFGEICRGRGHGEYSDRLLGGAGSRRRCSRLATTRDFLCVRAYSRIHVHWKKSPAALFVPYHCATLSLLRASPGWPSWPPVRRGASHPWTGHPAGRPPVVQTRSCAFVGHQLRFRWQRRRRLSAVFASCVAGGQAARSTCVEE
jgi:hypothetical protein